MKGKNSWRKIEKWEECYLESKFQTTLGYPRVARVPVYVNTL